MYVLPEFDGAVIDLLETIEMHREITIPGSPDSIPGARRELMEFLKQQGCPEDSAFEVGMAVQEALANAVLHGCNSNPELHVTIKASSDPAGVSIIIQDPGSGFDLSQVPDPSSDEGRTSSNGRGIHMMKAYMDDVTFAQQGREVRMRKIWESRGDVSPRGPATEQEVKFDPGD